MRVLASLFGESFIHITKQSSNQTFYLHTNWISIRTKSSKSIKMRRAITLFLLVALVAQQSDASFEHLERIVRRQSGSAEQESTTAKSPAANPQAAPKLYPDLPADAQQPPPLHHPHHGPTPFVPFGIQMVPSNRLNADQQPMLFGRMPPQPRPLTPAERLQSQSFADGLGKRLLSMIGIGDTSAAENRSMDDPRVASGSEQQLDAAKALQNLTVLQQLNKGVNSIYGSLSKMYNSTVQEQLNLLQQRFQQEAGNSSDPWHQQMAQRVPEFFKRMAMKVGDAQDQLNKVWRDLGNGTQLASQVQAQSRSLVDRLTNGPQAQQVGDFFSQFGNPFGNMFPSQQGNMGAPQQQPQNDFGAQVRDFWITRVQPQLGMVRNQVARAWRDLASSGALAPETVVRSRNSNSLGGSSPTQNASADLVESILKEVDLNSAEYSILEPASTNEGAINSGESSSSPPTGGNQTARLSPQMQNGLVAAQRELNQLWLGLTRSLQGALGNVQSALNPRPQFTRLDMAQTAPRPNTPADPAQSEVESKIIDLSKLQRDADMVYDTLQQQQREQQRQSVGDRFRNFFNNVDLSGVEQLPNRIGEQFNRFGTVVGDLWNQIPDRWDNFMQNVRPQPQPQMMNARQMTASTSTTQKPLNVPS